MFIREVTIDGFKSYATRTNITGWDSQFNAITGLNGSGKSNILDALCFVLGITNLSQVRASNLQDLVYKMGQAGVSKATVSILFDNTDPAQSPIGYEHCDTINVTRQVIIGGRNKYLINGKNAQASAVANLFQSVGLNINNPHFLIMQGRITKVLNMKPLETLSMIEEAAGTRMFEAKKQAAIKTIEKKQAKVEEINKVLAEEITPTLEKLRAERAAYLKWASNNTEAERLARFVVASDFCRAESTRDGAAAEAKRVAASIVTLQAKVRDLKARAAKEEAAMRAAEDARAASVGGAAFRALVDAEEGLGKELVKHTTGLQHRRAAAKDDARAHAALTAAHADAQTALATAQAELTRLRAEAARQATAAATAAEDVAGLISRVNAAAAGMTLDGGKGGSSTADAIIATRSRLSSLQAEVTSGDMRAKALRRTAKELSDAATASAAEHKALVAAADKAKAAAATAAAALAALRFDAGAAEELRVKREGLAAEASGAAASRIESEAASLAHMRDFAYDASALGPAWDASKVHGVLATLLRVARPEAATALEVGAGGRLFHVVIDDAATGKALLERGRLRKRTTFVPLSEVRRSRLTPAQIAEARRVAGGSAAAPRVWSALELITYAPADAAAMEYAFGGFLVAVDAATAKAVTFAAGVRAPCVTFEGDMFDPAGTLEGGSAPAGAAGATPLLLRLGASADAVAGLAAKRAALAKVEAELASLSRASVAHAAASSAAELSAHEASIAVERVGASQMSALGSRSAETAAALAAEEAAIAAAKASLKEAQAELKTLEAEAANAKATREAQIKAYEKQLSAAQKGAAAADAAAKASAHAADALACDVEASTAEAAAMTAQIAAAAAAVAKSAAAVTEAEAKVAALRGEYDAAKAALAAGRAAIAEADRSVKALGAARDAALAEAESATAEAAKAETRSRSAAKEAAAADRLAADLLAKHPWIEGERQFFGRAHTDYDFEARDAKEASAALAALEKAQAELERGINKKVVGMIETAEREYGDLVSKKRIIENDKAKIEKVICELDEKKNEALKTTWVKVNADFGSIFSTMLPGVTARLDPPAGGSVLEGLEVKVAFHGVWKESLTELSGGQRSLLALSLILALLLFKPAPLYILDEVDSALDLSHTQNIGHMIRTHFSRSQFIVVSLKQGMFSNANVLFRTRFVEGVGSTVLRTVSAEAAAAASAGAGRARGGAAPAAAIEDGAAEEEGGSAERGGAGGAVVAGRKRPVATRAPAAAAAAGVAVASGGGALGPAASNVAGGGGRGGAAGKAAGGAATMAPSAASGVTVGDE